MSNITTRRAVTKVQLVDSPDGETLTIETNDDEPETRYVISYEDAITHSLTYEELSDWVNTLRGEFDL